MSDQTTYQDDRRAWIRGFTWLGLPRESKIDIKTLGLMVGEKSLVVVSWAVDKFSTLGLLETCEPPSVWLNMNGWKSQEGDFAAVEDEDAESGDNPCAVAGRRG